MVPISESGQTKPTGIFIAGINPFRPLDDTYRSFIGLFVGQLAAGISSAHAYQAEKRRAEALAEIDRAKTTFFSNVSHEFRTPLTLILGPLTDLLDEHREFPNQAAEELRVVHRNSLRLLKLVNSLLDFSRIEAGRVKATYLPTDLAAFTNDLASMFRSATDKAGLTYTIETRPLSQPAYVDREMWEKIVLNLLSNAFKFTLKGGISVRLFEEDGWIRLIVSDTGSGISTLELPRLFERFHRVEGTKGRTHEGTGIGLALVAELIKLHGGTIDVASELDQGSTFRVSLPIGKSHLPAERIGADAGEQLSTPGSKAFVEEALRWLPPSGEMIAINETIGQVGADQPKRPPLLKRRIVVADDNHDMRDYLRRLLSDRYEVTVVADGREAIRAARETMPSLILADVMMPNLDGFGLLQAVRDDENLTGIPVILLSARAGEEATLDGVKAGADDYLVKPFSAANFSPEPMHKLSENNLKENLRMQNSACGPLLLQRRWPPGNGILLLIMWRCPTRLLKSSVYGLIKCYPVVSLASLWSIPKMSTKSEGSLKELANAPKISTSSFAL